MKDVAWVRLSFLSVTLSMHWAPQMEFYIYLCYTEVEPEVSLEDKT